MKRVKAACILQTLIFAQKPEINYSKERALQINKEEFEHYKATLERTKTRYQIVDVVEEDNGTLIVHVKKQLNNKTDISEYFE